MRRLAFAVLIALALSGCSSPTSNRGDSSSGGYTIHVKMVNVPEAVLNHKVQIDVEQRTGESSLVRNAQVNATASNSLTIDDSQLTVAGPN